MLAEQQSRNSEAPSRPGLPHPLGRLSTQQYWLPPEAISLHGVPEFITLSETDRIRLSHYEFLNFIEVGLWLEGMFMECIARSM